jgi:hypothetical protein
MELYEVSQVMVTKLFGCRLGFHHLYEKHWKELHFFSCIYLFIYLGLFGLLLSKSVFGVMILKYLYLLLFVVLVTGAIMDLTRGRLMVRAVLEKMRCQPAIQTGNSVTVSFRLKY